MITETNQFTPAKKIEFVGCEYKLIQRYRHNLCLYSSGGTFIVVEFKPEEGPGHQYYVVGHTLITGQSWSYDGEEYDLKPNTTNSCTGYAIPIK